FNFEIRKSLLEYDEVMDEQRKRVYTFRQRILDGVSCREIVQDMIRDQIDSNLATFLDDQFGAETFASYAGKIMTVDMDPRLFRKVSGEEAVKICLDEAERQAESDIISQIDVHLSESEEEEDWNWAALAHFANSRWQLGVRDRDLKAAGRDRVDEFLVNKARDSIRRVKIEGADQMLAEDFGIETATRWIQAKFGIEVKPDEFRDQEFDYCVDLVAERAVEKYDEKEAVYPVMAGLYQFEMPASGGAQGRLDREGLVQWASRRFESEISIDDLKNKQREEIRELLIGKSRGTQTKAQTAIESLHDQLTNISRTGGIPLSGANGEAKKLTDWFKETLDYELPMDKVESLGQDELEQTLEAIVENHYHPEIRRMERMVLLEIVDSGWKDHLLAMDYLRSAVGHRGMAQLDPKVEYKREGMRMFDGLWVSIGERVTDLIFRMEQMNSDFVSDTLKETSARHEDVSQATPQPLAPGGVNQEQQDAADSSNTPQKVETIRNRDKKVGRNEPCPCGSGKKFKSCCMRKRA
ncbi:MAG: SEC-C metal-binding domain-containing protein, partial [Planctomycetota bacterium]